MRLKGIRRYPQTVKSVTPTKHKYGADVTWSQNTDTYKPTIEGHGIDVEINMFKYNFVGTILLNHQTDDIYRNDIRSVLNTGIFEAGLYFRSQENEQTQIEWYKNLIGSYPSYLSYANGNRDKDNFALNNSLVSRYSNINMTRSVSYDFEKRLEQPTSCLFNYDCRDTNTETALETADSALRDAVATSGWFNDFSHWHWADFYGDLNQFESLFSRQRSILNGVNAVSLSSGEAVEYMWLRKQFKRGGLYQDGNDLVLICDVWNEADLPYKTIDTTLSVEVDLTGTNLEEKDIISNTDILKISNNKFIVQVPYSKKDGFSTVRLTATTTPDYTDLSPPTIVSSTNSGSVINITTDNPTNAVLFSVPVGGDLYLAEVEGRSNSMSENHEIRIKESGRDYYVGVITKEKQSILSGKL